ncbi:unnamed protein product [Symbiodinium sp. KB8]|nr:unnamed protein product [Symbiodinium sp. KB8]
MKGLKVDVFKPATREEELRGWKEWWFGFSTYVCGHDGAYEDDFKGIDLNVEVDHSLMSDAEVERSRKLYSLLCSLLKGRPLLLIKGLESSKNGLEAIRLLRLAMEPQEKTRSLALLRQLATWTFQSGVGLQEQIVKYEEALKMYEDASGKEYPQEMVLATVVNGLKDPLRSQVQMRLTNRTTYAEVKEWVMQFENLNAPWSSSLQGGRGQRRDEPQPMEIDAIKGKPGKGKDKGSKGKDKNGKPGKGKDKGKGKGKPGEGKGWSSWNSWQDSGSKWKQQPGGWKQYGDGSSSAGGWSNGGSWGSGTWNTGKDTKGKTGKGKGGGCNICGDPRHWKNECPKAKGKGVSQVEQQASSASSVAAASTSASSLPSSASALRGQANYGINHVSAFDCGTPPGCRVTEVFDISELEDEGEFSLEGPEVLMISAVGLSVGSGAFPFPAGIPVFSMDHTDGDGQYTVAGDAQEVCQVLAVIGQAQEIDVVIDSGADVSVAPLHFRNFGCPTRRSGIVMQDAQGKQITEVDTRILEVGVQTLAGDEVTIKERFCIAKLRSTIISLGRLLRAGWLLGDEAGRPVIHKGPHKVPIRLRRNTLTVGAMISEVAAPSEEEEAEPTEKAGHKKGTEVPNTERGVNMLTFDDIGPLPPELEDVVQVPGWHIVPSGLPVLVTHATEELELERFLWNSDDWCWLAVFVKIEASKGLPKAGDAWVQALAEIDEELAGKHDTVVVLHVDELPKNLLTEPRDYFKEPFGGEVVVPAGDNGAGVGEDPMEVVGEGRTHEREQADEIEEGVRLEEATPLKELRELCGKLGLPKSGGKPKVLRRLRDYYETLEKRLSSEIARKMYQESERLPDVPRLPKLPSATQQELHNVTHHPFAAWCEACVLGRSKQTAHPKADPEQPVEEARKGPRIEIDYCYTFTKHRHELQEGEDNEPRAADQRAEGDGDDAARRPEAEDPERKAENPDEGKVDYRDQYGLTLVAAESSTGWLLAIPVLEKGAGALKRVVEQLVRLSLQVAPGQSVLFQGDPEPSIRQIINACEACRARLGLATEKRWVPRASHASNGQAEKAIQTIRTNGLTLRSFVEARIGASIEGHRHFYPWVMRHAGFLYNRFSVNPRGATSYELMHGRVFRGQLVPLGEQVLYYRPSKHRGDLQWCRGIWLGVHERNGAHLIGTAEGIHETSWPGRQAEQPQRQFQAVLQYRLPGLDPDLGRGLTKLVLIPLQALAPEVARHENQTDHTRNYNSDFEHKGPITANRRENQTDHRRNHDSDFKHKGVSRANRHENQTDHRRNHDSDFKHKGVQPVWTQVAQVEFQGKGVNQICDDIPGQELAGLDTWDPEVEEALEEEWYNADGIDEAWWDEYSEKPPEVTEEELVEIDRRADLVELERLMNMGVARFPTEGEDLTQHELLTTKLVRDWRKRPGWTRRARLVAREFRTLSAWTSDMFAPASSLAIVHTLISYALTNDLELTTLDVKDAYLNVDQPSKVVIQVSANLFEEGGLGTKTLVLEKLLPGQRVGASSWYEMAKGILAEAGMESFAKEPTVFKATGREKSALILHADDGLLASSKGERERIIGVFAKKVKVQIGDPMVEEGDTLEFLKRKYVRVAAGVAVYSNSKYLEALLKAAGSNAKRKESPADQTFQEPDDTKELDPKSAKMYKECVGRLLYLAHSRPDIQMADCVLSSRMSQPTTGAKKQLFRVIGYLAGAPDLGFLIKPIVPGARLKWPGNGNTTEVPIYEVEAVTDADWAGCKRSRRSRTSIQLYVGGGLVGSMVRSQRSIALSSAESEYLALVSGACEAIYVVDVLRFLVENKAEVRLTCLTDSAACRGICQRLGAGRVRHLQCAVLWVQQAVRSKQLRIGTISGADNPADIGTKPLGGSRIRELLWTMGCLEADGSEYGLEDHEAAQQKKEIAAALKELKNSGHKVGNVKAILPLVLLLSQVGAVQGLGLAAVAPKGNDEEWVATVAVTIGLGIFVLMLVYGIPWGVMKLLKWSFSIFQSQGVGGQCEKGVQASRGMSPKEEKFTEEYVNRCTEMRQVISEQRAELDEFEKVVRKLRTENAELRRAQRPVFSKCGCAAYKSTTAEAGCNKIVPALLYTQSVCRHFLEGKCTYGGSCRFLHTGDARLPERFLPPAVAPTAKALERYGPDQQSTSYGYRFADLLRTALRVIEI